MKNERDLRHDTPPLTCCAALGWTRKLFPFGKPCRYQPTVPSTQNNKVPCETETNQTQLFVGVWYPPSTHQVEETCDYAKKRKYCADFLHKSILFYQVMSLHQLAELWKISCWRQHTSGHKAFLAHKSPSPSLQSWNKSRARTPGTYVQRTNNSSTRTKEPPLTTAAVAVAAAAAVVSDNDVGDCPGDHSISINADVGGTFATDEEAFFSRGSGGGGRGSSRGGCDREAKAINDRNAAEVEDGVEDGAEERQGRASKVLGFAAFLDLLGR